MMMMFMLMNMMMMIYDFSHSAGETDFRSI